MNFNKTKRVGRPLRRRLEDERGDTDMALDELNKFRESIGMKPLTLKARPCSRCGKEFLTIHGYSVETNCGCAKSYFSSESFS